MQSLFKHINLTVPADNICSSNTELTHTRACTKLVLTQVNYDSRVQMVDLECVFVVSKWPDFNPGYNLCIWLCQLRENTQLPPHTHREQCSSCFVNCGTAQIQHTCACCRYTQYYIVIPKAALINRWWYVCFSVCAFFVTSVKDVKMQFQQPHSLDKNASFQHSPGQMCLDMFTSHVCRCFML